MKTNSIITLMIAGAFPLFAGCNGGNGNNSGPASSSQPGTSSQTSSDLIKKCDTQRVALRKTSMEFLGIDALQIQSDKVIKEIDPSDLKKIVNDGIEYSEPTTSKQTQNEDYDEITSIMDTATKEAGIDNSSPTIISGTNPVREIHIGKPDYIDGAGNFSVGSASLQKMTGIQVGDIYGVILGVGLNPDPTKSFQTYSIGLLQITNAKTADTVPVTLGDYVEKQLPAYCNGTATSLSAQTFNTIPVGASLQPGQPAQPGN